MAQRGPEFPLSYLKSEFERPCKMQVAEIGW
jgi:hypothetical protein